MFNLHIRIKLYSGSQLLKLKDYMDILETSIKSYRSDGKNGVSS